MTLQQGWAALASRRLDAAHQAFMQANQHDSHRSEALRGLSRVAMLQGDLDSAERLVQQSMNMEPSPHTMLVKALVQGERGQRADAYKKMAALKLVMPHDGFLLAAMAEQRIRQGYWDEGSALFVESLNHDPQGLAFAHIREVMCDMSEAIAAGRLPADDPLKMLNRIDYNSSQSTSPFFAAARRHINKGEVVPRDAGAAAIKASSKPANMQSHSVATQSHATPSVMATHANTPRTMSPTYTQTSQRSSSPLTRNAFTDSMSEERAINATLQDNIQALPSSGWPSQQTTFIDTIPTIASSTRSVALRLAEDQQSTFRVTEGNIFVQLYMERCFEAFTYTIPTELTGGIVLDPALFTFLDLNLLDGTLSKDFEVTTSDLTEITLADHAVSAFAYFLGESLARTYGGTWSYHERPDHAEVHIESQTIKPYALCAQWLNDSSRDPGVIYQLIEQLDVAAKHADHTGNARKEYIDPTADTSDQELVSKLAELWSFYCIRHARTPAPQIAKQLKVIKDFNSLVLFEVNAGISPSPPVPHAAHHPKTKRLFYAYRRRTGEFLMLGRPACMAHVLGELFGALTSDNAGEIVRFIATYHSPGALLVESDEAANSQFSSLNVAGPKLMRQGTDNTSLSVWIVAHKKARELVFSCVTHEDGVYWRLDR